MSLRKNACNLSSELDDVFNESYIDLERTLSHLPNSKKIENIFKSDVIANNKFTIKRCKTKCINLIPTQSEIDITKSLYYSLTKSKDVSAILCDETMNIGNSDIITFNKNYIIDGHHRWSQVFSINPQCSIYAIDFKNDSISPMTALKTFETAIYATLGRIEKEDVTGQNLFHADKNKIIEFVFAIIDDDTFDVFKRLLGHKSIDDTCEYVYDNCKLLQLRNRHIKNAPPRNVMPQTDDVLDELLNILRK